MWQLFIQTIQNPVWLSYPDERTAREGAEQVASSGLWVLSDRKEWEYYPGHAVTKITCKPPEAKDRK